MMKKFILATAAITTLMTLSACSFGGSQGDEEIIAEEGTSEELEGLGLEGEEGLADDGSMSLDDETQTAETTLDTDVSASGDSTVAQTIDEDQLSLDSFGEGTPSDMAANDVPDANSMVEPVAPETDTAMTEPVAPDTGALEIAPPTTMTEVAEQNTPVAMTDLDQEESKPKLPSLQKVASTPWKISGKWVNGIYFARPGDSLSSISQTIYGDDRSNELKKINPTYNNREVKPGDKVYYASPMRPDDASTILTHFEEKNIPSKTYTAQSGDNIRKVSEQLLGYSQAWKEVWSYNSLESKQGMDEGTVIRYWDVNLASMSTPPMAEQAPTPPPMDTSVPPSMPEMPSQDTASANSDFPPPPDFSSPDPGMETADLPPPPPPMDIPPPPPPPMDIPPPPPPVAQADTSNELASAVAEDDQILVLGAIGLVVVSGALFIIRRKRKQKELEQSLGETHVG